MKSGDDLLSSMILHAERGEMDVHANSGGLSAIEAELVPSKR